MPATRTPRPTATSLARSAVLLVAAGVLAMAAAAPARGQEAPAPSVPRSGQAAPAGGGLYWLRTDRDTARVGEPVRFVVAGPDGPCAGAQVTARLVEPTRQDGWLDGGTTPATGQVSFVFDHAGDWEVVAVVPGGPPAVLPFRVLAAPRLRSRLVFWIPVGILLLAVNLRAAWTARRRADEG